MSNNGIVFFQDGTVSFIGNVTDLTNIVIQMERSLPKFKEAIKASSLNAISDEELEQELLRRKNAETVSPKE